MASIAPRRFGSRGIGSLAAILLALEPVSAGVSASTQINSYRVSGATASDVIAYMRRNPFHGDSGAAVANIRPTYALSISPKQGGGACRATVDLKVRFVMTLPVATGASGMSPATRSAWSSFVAFARRHEEQHRAIYLQCANEFVAKASRMTASTCVGLNAGIRSLLESSKRNCNARQVAFDRRDSGRMMGLTLFAMAGSPGRKLAKVRKPVTPAAEVVKVSAPASGLIGPR